MAKLPIDVPQNLFNVPSPFIVRILGPGPRAETAPDQIYNIYSIFHYYAICISQVAENGKYRAPSLERGIEALQVLAAARRPMSLAALCRRMDKSVGELFRVLQVLEEEGYISVSRSGYKITERLYSLCVADPFRDLVEQARPAMQELTQATEQSCYLATLAGADAMIVSYTPSPGYLGLTAEPGLRFPLVRSAAGSILMAYQPEAVRSAISIADEAKCHSLISLRRDLTVIRMEGFAIAHNPQIAGVTDIAAPVRLDAWTTAALTIPFLASRHSAPEQLVRARQRLCETAQNISATLADQRHESAAIPPAPERNVPYRQAAR